MLRRLLRKIKTLRKKNNKPGRTTTYSKLLLSSLVVISAMWITWSYILATHAQVAYGNSDPLMSLSEEVCRTILGAVIVYGTKSGVENVSKGLTGDFSADDEDAAG